MRFRSLIGVLAGGALVVGGGLLTGASAVAETSLDVSQAYEDSGGVVHYAYDSSSRPSAVMRTVAGTEDSKGGCRFDNQGPGRSGVVVIVDEVSYDPATCTHVLSVATYPSGSVPAAVTASLATPSNTKVSTTASSPSKSSNAAALTSWSEKLSAWIGDPIGIHVSETNVTRTWDSGGGWHNDHHWGWYSLTGWSRDSYSQVDTATVGDTIGQFENTAFCPGLVIDYHYKTRLTTSSSGSWDWSYSLYKNGACDHLLSYHYALG